jgi:site-specific recombinase XerD
MFTQIFKCSRTIERHLAGPLLESRLRYLTHYAEQGAALDTIQGIADNLLVIAEQMKLSPEGEVRREEIIAAADRWAGRQPRHPSMTHTKKSRSRFISVATYWLEFLGRLAPVASPPRPYAHLLTKFADYMSGEKGLAPLTIKTECWHVEHFLHHFYAQHQSLDELTIKDIDEALILKRSQVRAVATVRLYSSSIRAFLRLAEAQGWCAPGLAAAMLSPRVFRQKMLPVGPSWEEAQRLLATTEGDQPKNIRDRAILMLLLIYGLRSGEVCALRLEDLDWERELIHVPRGKQRCTQRYPLTSTVGEAILRYLKEVRPRSTHREIFLSLRAPIHPLVRESLYRVVRNRLRPMDDSLRHYGPHMLRHTCATHLLAEGYSLKEIGDHLGHRDPEATRIYAKVDASGLRQVADFSLKGVL